MGCGVTSATGGTPTAHYNTGGEGEGSSKKTGGGQTDPLQKLLEEIRNNPEMLAQITEMVANGKDPVF